MKKIIIILLSLFVLSNVYAEEVPEITLGEIRDNGGIIENVDGTYTTNYSSYNFSYSIDKQDDNYCLIIYNKTKLDFFGKGFYYEKNGYYYDCDYSLSDTFYDYDSSDKDVIIGFVKKEDIDAVEEEHDNDDYSRYYYDLDAYNIKSFHIKRNKTNDKVLFDDREIYDDNNNPVFYSSQGEYYFITGKNYYVKYKITNHNDNIHYKYQYCVRETDEDGCELTNKNININNGYIIIPLDFLNVESGSFDLYIGAYNNLDEEISETNFCPYFKFYDKLPNITVGYKNYDIDPSYYDELRFYSKYYNEDNPLEINIDLSSFEAGNYNVVINFLGYDYESDESVTLYTKNVSLIGKQNNEVIIDDYIPSFDAENYGYIFETLTITIDNVKYYTQYLTYSYGKVSQVIYNKDGMRMNILDGFGGMNEYSTHYRENIFGNNFYIAHSGSNFEDDREFNYSISITNNKITKTIKTGKILGSELNNYVFLNNMKLVKNKGDKITFRLFDDKYNTLESITQGVRYGDEYDEDSTMDIQNGKDYKNVFSIISRRVFSIEDNIILKIKNEKYDTNKTYNYLVFKEETNDIVDSGTINGSDIISGKEISFAASKLGVSEGENLSVYIYEKNSETNEITNRDYYSVNPVVDVYSKSDYNNLELVNLTLFKNIINSLEDDSSIVATKGAETTKKLSYTLEYYKNDVLFSSENLNEEVPLLDKSFDINKESLLNKFEGFTLSSISKEKGIRNNETVKVYYKSNGVPIVKAAPTLVVKNGNNNTLNLSWDKIENATKYAIYRSDNNKKYSKLLSTTDTSYIDTGLVYGKTYYYRVKAYNSESEKTSKVVSGVTKPNKMIIEIVSSGTNNIKLDWDKVKVTGYSIYQSTDNINWEKIKNVEPNSTLELNVKSLKANKTYYFRARAYKTVDGTKVYGSYSTVVSSKTAPVKPEFEVKIKSYNSMSLVVGASKGASEYRLYRSMDNSSWERIATLTSEGTYIDGSHDIGRVYYYKVKACNTKGYCSGYVYDELKQSVKTPKIVVETQKAKKVKITINSVDHAEGYKIYRSEYKNSGYETIAEITDLTNLTFTDKTKSGYTYYYKVRAYSKGYNGKRVFSPYTGVKSVTSK